MDFGLFAPLNLMLMTLPDVHSLEPHHSFNITVTCVADKSLMPYTEDASVNIVLVEASLKTLTVLSVITT